MKTKFLLFFLTYILLSSGNSAFSATVNSCTLSVAKIGNSAAGSTASGSLAVTSASPAGTSFGTNGKVIVAGNNAILTTTSTGSGPARNGKTKVFITSGGGTSTFSMTGPGAAIPTRVSLGTTSGISSAEATVVSGVGTFTIRSFATIGAAQAAGNYSGSYSVVVCSCNNNSCPSNTSNSLCTNAPTCTII